MIRYFVIVVLKKVFYEHVINFTQFILYAMFYMFFYCSFFVVEDHVLNTGNGLVTRAYLDEVWENALSKIVASLRTPSVSFYTIRNVNDILIIFINCT